MWDEDDSADYDLPTERERGRWLTAAICFVIGYGLALIVLVIMFDSTRGVLAPGWLLPLVIGVGLAEIVAGIALWRWKMWGLYLYLAATIVAIFLAVLSAGSLLVVYARIVPFAVVGYIIRPKWEHFDGF
ncbi:MAG: hypothetical protein M9928_02510 [Anaerolineae bacterium]|nr:hypothetical protein [Anaerolineae bacterium]MCO5192400.1 hypothetical protein [Anaerolineae bacterium]MCO5198512.1 hypothetical protein [Anaerolineae bacterium]MCO5203878.1 hypothetical protein [Anaerolineae bacterium]